MHYRGPHLGPPPLDITDRDRALRERRELDAKLEAAHQEERPRIARDIHDELVQLPAGVAFDLGSFVAHLPDSAPPWRLRGVSKASTIFKERRRIYRIKSPGGAFGVLKNAGFRHVTTLRPLGPSEAGRD